MITGVCLIGWLPELSLPIQHFFFLADQFHSHSFSETENQVTFQKKKSVIVIVEISLNLQMNAREMDIFIVWSVLSKPFYILY